jgi:hypothetical protein
MRLLHSAARTNAAFDAENVVSLAGLVPVMRLAQEAIPPTRVLAAGRSSRRSLRGCPM